MEYIPGGNTELMLSKILTKGINYVDNFDCAILEVTITSADTPQEIRHSLGRVPIGYHVIYQNIEAIIWGPQLASWTEEVLYLASSVANVELRLLVM